MDIKNSIVKGFNKTKNTVVKYSPEILIATGIITGVAGAVLACKATLKVNDILVESKEQIDAIHEAEEHPELCKEEYTEKDAKKDIAITYVQTGAKLAKIYAPAVILGCVSVASVLSAYGITKKRTAALAMAYASAESAFKKYREKVVDKLGEDADNEFLFGTGEKLKVSEVVPNEETGENKIVKKSVPVYKLDEVSEFAIDFRDSKHYSGLQDVDLNTIAATQRYLNERFNAYSDVITLNQVLDELAIVGDPNDERMNRIRKAGMIVGWKKEKDERYGDNRIIFKVIETAEEVNGEIRPYLIIDFNVDSKDIYSRL